ncbi:MAG: response regulator [Spirochaetaceae bacterium]|nr:MAG: response regulator [Spirochaetaceae bacterium]
MNGKIFILDDEKDIVNLLILNLAKNCFYTKGFFLPQELLQALQRTIPDLLILDLMLPEIDGMELCKQLKNDTRHKNIPIIMLTARQEETDKVLGLELGADDYIVKPFSPKELVARVKAVLRRGKEVRTAGLINLGDLLKIDLQKYEVSDASGKKIVLTQTEFKILVELAQQRGWVFSREKLINMIWGDTIYITERNIDVHIRHLREKLGKAGKLITNVRGVGYKLAE